MADTNRNGTPASAAMALARYVLPVPGGPSKSRPRRGVPPISARNARLARKRLSERTTSAFTRSMPLTSASETSICSGRYVMCGERPATSVTPSVVTIMTPKKTPTISRNGSIVGSDSWVRSNGRPSMIRHHIHSIGTARTNATRPSRNPRARSRAAPTSLVAVASRPVPTSSSIDISHLLWLHGGAGQRPVWRDRGGVHPNGRAVRALCVRIIYRQRRTGCDRATGDPTIAPWSSSDSAWTSAAAAPRAHG